MDLGVTRTFEAALGTLTAAAFAGALSFATAHPARAQDAVTAPPAPALSQNCQAPVGDIALPGPLPNLEGDLQAGKTIRVLAIGSSSTVGVGASSPALNYPSVFESILEKNFKGLDVVIVNRGVSGEAAAATADRLRTLVAIEKPDLVLWQVGTNDALLRVPLGDFVATVRDTVRWLKEHKVDTVLVGLQYTPHVVKDEHYTAMRAGLREVAVAENVMLVRRYEAMEFIEKAKAGPLLATDQLHLNDLGYRCMAEHVARAVVVGAFLRGKAAKAAR